MKKLLLTALFLSISTAAYAEKWICYDPGSTPANQVNRRVQGDCLALGICSGPNNTGLDPNCFEAQGSEWNDANGSFKKVDPVQAPGSRIIDWTAQEISDAQAADQAAQTSANRDSATTEVDEFSGPGVRNRALIELFNKRDNYLVNRIVELQTALLNLQASAGNAGNRLNALPSIYMATNTRTKADAVLDFKNDINAGNQDT